MIAPTGPDHFSIVTVLGPSASPPAWETMFGWPRSGLHAVPLDVHDPGERKIWAAKFDQVVQQADRAVLIVADGLGCAAAAWWARLSPADYVARIAGAVLLAPQDEGDTAFERHRLFASPRVRLPFPSLVIQPGATTCPTAIADWGSRLIVSRRARQHAPGGIAWRGAQRMFLRLTSGIAEPDIAAGRLLAR